MRRPVVFLFSGQGSHFQGMGAELYRANDAFRHAMDSILAAPALGGLSLARILYGPRDGTPFDRTLHTHPALYATQVSLAGALKAQGIVPDYLLGYSLGEYVALAVSGAISIDQGISMIMAQARALEEHAPAGAMLAVLENPGLMHADPYLFRGTWTAAINYDRHFVVTGPKSVVRDLVDTLAAREIPSQLLAVSHAFHSPLVDPAEPAFRAHVAGMPINRPQVPIYSARQRGRVDLPSVDYLWSVCRGPVGFRETVHALEASVSPIYVDLGPSATLAGFARSICGDPSRCIGTINQWGRDVEAIANLHHRLGIA